MELPLRDAPRSDRVTVATAIRRYIDAKTTLRRTIENPRHAQREEIQIARAASLGDTHHSVWAWDFLAGERRHLLAERVAGGAGLAVFLSDWLALSSSARFRDLHSAASPYVRAVVDLAGGARCLGGSLAPDLTRQALLEFTAAAELHVSARAEQVVLERRGVVRACVEQNVRARRRMTVSSAAIVSELITLETDLVALA